MMSDSRKNISVYNNRRINFCSLDYITADTISQQIIMVLTALLASIGTAAIPMASLVTMTIIFSAVGLPLEGIAIVMPVERLLDMCRTTVNVWSDCCGAVTIAKSEGETLKV